MMYEATHRGVVGATGVGECGGVGVLVVILLLLTLVLIPALLLAAVVVVPVDCN
jgi:hypothetical protein